MRRNYMRDGPLEGEVIRAPKLESMVRDRHGQTHGRFTNYYSRNNKTLHHGLGVG